MESLQISPGFDGTTNKPGDKPSEAFVSIQ
jgi:hypothetical protein